MSVWDVIVVYAAIPAAIVALVAVLTVGVSRHRSHSRYEPGQEWHHSPRFWAGVTPVVTIPVEDRVGTRRGGAHGTW